MLLLDEMCSYESTRSACRLTVRADSTFSGERGVPAYVALEYMAQAVAAHGGRRSLAGGAPAKIGFLLGTRRITLARSHFAPGTDLRVEVEAEGVDEDPRLFTCRVRDEMTGEIVAEARIGVLLPEDPDALIEARESVRP